MRKLGLFSGLLLVAGTAMLCLSARSRANDDIPKVFVPNVLGYTHDMAKIRLEAVGLTLDARGGSMRGKVRSQSPAAGTQLDIGSTVTAVFFAPGVPIERP